MTRHYICHKVHDPGCKTFISYRSLKRKGLLIVIYNYFTMVRMQMARSMKMYNCYLIGVSLSVFGLASGMEMYSHTSLKHLDFFTKYYTYPTKIEENMLRSSNVLGAIAGSVLGGEIAAHFGYNKALKCICAIWFVGIIFTFVSETLLLLALGKMVKGIAIGMSHAVIPIFQYEIIPTPRRGRILSFYILATGLGNLLMYLLPMMAMPLIRDEKYLILHWLVDLVPLTIATISVMLFPESPKWLAANNDWTEAADVLESIETANSEKNVKSKLGHERRRLGDKHYVVKKYSTAVNVRSCSVNELFGRKYFREVNTGILLQLTIDLIGVIKLLNSMYAICLACQIRTMDEIKLVHEFDLVMRIVFIIAPIGIIDLLRRKDVLIFGMVVNTILMSAYAALYLVFSRPNEPSFFNLDFEWGLKVEFGKTSASMVLALTVLMDVVFHSIILPVCWLYILETFSSSTRSKGWVVVSSLHWLFECSLSLIFPFFFSSLNGWLIVILFLISLGGSVAISQLKESKEKPTTASVFEKIHSSLH